MLKWLIVCIILISAFLCYKFNTPLKRVATPVAQGVGDSGVAAEGGQAGFVEMNAPKTGKRPTYKDAIRHSNPDAPVQVAAPDTSAIFLQ